MTTRLEHCTQKGRAEPELKCTALMGVLTDEPGLEARFERPEGTKAPGVDGVTKAVYAEGLDTRLAALSARLRRVGYRPTPARRRTIPKGDGRYRPLGIPALEDRGVQDRRSLIVQALWAPECSDGA